MGLQEVSISLKDVHIKEVTKVDSITRGNSYSIANKITRQFDLWELNVHQLSLLGLSKNL